MNTAFELWFDDAFLIKRIGDQDLYLAELELRFIRDNMDKKRFQELKDTALFIKARIEHQLYRPHPVFKTYD